MKHKTQVIAEFVDRQTGKRIRPGDDVPAHMTDDALRRLQRRGCLASVPVVRASAGGRSSGKRGQKNSGQSAGGSGEGSLFPGGEPKSSQGDPDSAAVAGADGSAAGGGSESDPVGSGAGSGKS